MKSQRQTELPVNMQRLVRFLAAMLLTLGLSVLAGWAWDIDTLKRVLSGMNSMKANTAIGFMLSGASLWLLTLRRESGALSGIRQLPAALTMLLGLVTFSEFIFDWNPGLDQLLFRETSGRLYSASPGRMSAFTALCFSLLGGALLLAGARRAWAIVQAIALLIGGVSLLALGGNMFGDPSFPNFPRSGAIAIHTAVAFLLVAIATLMATSRHGLVARLHGHLLNIGFGVALVVLLVASIAVYVGIERRQQAAEWVERSHDVLLRMESLSSRLHQYGENSRAYLLTGQEAALQGATAASGKLLADLAEVRRLTLADPAQQKRLAALEPLVRQRLAVGSRNERIRREQGAAAAAASLANGASDHLIAEINDRLGEMRGAEKQLLAKQQKALEITNSASIAALGIAMMLVLTLLLTTFPALQREIARRRRSEDELAHHRDHLEKLVQVRTTELERQNRRNELILGTTVDGFFSAGLDGRMLDANPAYCRMLGYSRAELQQLAIADVEGNENPQEVAAHVNKVIADGYDRFDTRQRRKDGSLVEVEISVNWVEIGGERIFYAFVRDISERKGAEQALILARDEAERANAAKSEFLSRMSHELRTPLNAILGFGQLLESDAEQPLNATQADNVQEILHAGQHLLELINEVLDLARIESGRMEVNLEAVAVAPLIESCVTQLRPLAAQRGIGVALELSAACAVQADRTRLKEVLLNLLSNAVKYNHKGGAIHLSCAPAGAQHLRISVRDSGRGIAAEAMPRLFKPFERIESAYEGIEGTGIGLALAKKLVEAMHGVIGVESVPGEGSTFWFELPLAAVGERGGEPAAAPPASADAGAERRKILYVEDNPANLRLMQKIIASRPGLELLDAVSAEDGLEIALSQHPDLILLDLNLPGMDGYAALRQLQHNPLTHDIPVIAVTANAMLRDVERGKAAGFSEYLTKPIDVAKFFDFLDRSLQGRAEGDT